MRSGMAVSIFVLLAAYLIVILLRYYVYSWTYMLRSQQGTAPYQGTALAYRFDQLGQHNNRRRS
jgi:hypothetical protein